MSKKPEPIQVIATPVLKIKRKLGGFDISATLTDAPEYRRVSARLDKVIDDFLRPYNAEHKQMFRTDASMVCSALSLQVKAFGIKLAQPFCVQ